MAMYMIQAAVAASVKAAHASGMSSVFSGDVWNGVRDHAVEMIQKGMIQYGEKGMETWKEESDTRFGEVVVVMVKEGTLPEDKAYNTLKSGKKKVRKNVWINSDGGYIDPPKGPEATKKAREEGSSNIFGAFHSASSVVAGAIEKGIDIQGKGKSEVQALLKDEKGKDEEKDDVEVVVPDEVMELARQLVEAGGGDRTLIYTAVGRALAMVATIPA